LGLASLLALAGAARAEPRTYVIDTQRSQLMVQVFKSGMLSGLGHDHLFLPQRWNGQIRFDPSAPEQTVVQLRVFADSLRDHEPGLSDADRAKVEAQTRGQVLEAERFPTIVLDATSLALDMPASPAGGGLEVHGVLVGTFTLHGVTRPLRIPVHATVTEGGISGTGGVTLSLKEFGIKPASAALGAVSVKDQVQVSFDLAAKPEAPR
jgi:polyisoprenoid-binding protein YceI